MAAEATADRKPLSRRTRIIVRCFAGASAGDKLRSGDLLTLFLLPMAMEENEGQSKQTKHQRVFFWFGNYGRAGNHQPKSARTRRAASANRRKIGTGHGVVKILARGGGRQVGDGVRQNPAPAPRNGRLIGVSEPARPRNSDAHNIPVVGLSKVLQEDMADGSGAAGSGDLRGVAGGGQGIVGEVAGAGLASCGDEVRAARSVRK